MLSRFTGHIPAESGETKEPAARLGTAWMILKTSATLAIKARTFCFYLSCQISPWSWKRAGCIIRQPVPWLHKHLIGLDSSRLGHRQTPPPPSLKKLPLNARFQQGFPSVLSDVQGSCLRLPPCKLELVYPYGRSKAAVWFWRIQVWIWSVSQQKQPEE